MTRTISGLASVCLAISLILVPVISLDSLNNQPITYGSLVKFQNPSSRKWLHSHEVRFGRGGFFSVTGFDHEDLGNYWQILEQYPVNTKTYNEPVRCGDVVRIKSSIMGYNLRVDETSFGLTTELQPMVHGMPDDKADSAINWKIKCNSKDEGDVLTFSDQIKLKHSVTGKYVLLDPSSQYTEFNCRGCEIIYQVEILAVENDSDEDHTSFQLIGGLTFSETAIEASQ